MPTPPSKNKYKDKLGSFKGAGGSTAAMKGAGGKTSMGASVTPNAHKGPIGLKVVGGVRMPTTSGGGPSQAKARDRYVSGTVRGGGPGYSGEKGNAPTPAARSAKMDAGKPTTPKRPGAPFGPMGSGAKPAKAVAKPKSDDYNQRSELGSFYLNATSGMFSPKAGGKKKK